jgi:hypothetical protein
MCRSFVLGCYPRPPLSLSTSLVCRPVASTHFAQFAAVIHGNFPVAHVNVLQRLRLTGNLNVPLVVAVAPAEQYSLGDPRMLRSHFLDGEPKRKKRPLVSLPRFRDDMDCSNQGPVLDGRVPLHSLRPVDVWSAVCCLSFSSFHSFLFATLFFLQIVLWDTPWRPSAVAIVLGRDCRVMADKCVCACALLRACLHACVCASYLRLLPQANGKNDLAAAPVRP